MAVDSSVAVDVRSNVTIRGTATLGVLQAADPSGNLTIRGLGGKTLLTVADGVISGPAGGAVETVSLAELGGLLCWSFEF